MKDSTLRGYEAYVLNGRKVSSALSHVVEGTEPYNYLVSLDALARGGGKLTPEQQGFIEAYLQKSKTPDSRRLALRYSLLRYPDLSPEERAKLLDRIASENLGLSFGYKGPTTEGAVTFAKEKGKDEPSASTAVMDRLDLQGEIQQLYAGKKSLSDFTRSALPLVDFGKLNDQNRATLLLIMGDDLVQLRSDGFFREIAKELQRQYDKTKTYELNPSVVRNMAIEQMERIAKLVPGVMLDSKFVVPYFGKKFSWELSREENDAAGAAEKRENLLKMLEFAGRLPESEYTKGLKCVLQLFVLDNGIKLNVYDEAVFQAYLNCPMYGLNMVMPPTKSDVYVWSETLKNVAVISEYTQQKVTDLVKSYLQSAFVRGSGIDQYTKYIEKSLLLPTFEDIMFVSGKPVETTATNMTRLERLAGETLITLCPHNKDRFEVGEEVTIFVELKNVPTLHVKVFEINTENYYRKDLSLFKTDINLDGLVASMERTVDHSALPSRLKHAERLEFPELKGQSGLFIVELIGGGKSSRAVLKIGTLSYISVPTVAGQLCYVLDGTRKVCSDDSTGIWLENSLYRPKEGKILVPYLASGGEKEVKAILLNKGAAQLIDFKRLGETYSLRCGFFLLPESVLMGQKASILVRPQLLLNGRAADLSLLRNIKCMLYTTTFEEKLPHTKEFPGLALSPAQEIVLSFQVGSQVADMRIEFSAEVEALTTRKKLVLTASQSFDYVSGSEAGAVANPCLRLLPAGRGYQLELLGRNGESLPNTAVKLSFRSPGLGYAVERDRSTDSNGGIILGKLVGVSSLSASISGFTKSWTLPPQVAMLYPTYIDVLEGERIEIPVAADVARDALCLKCCGENGLVVSDCSSHAAIEASEERLYANLAITGLSSGTYSLAGHDPRAVGERITIRVHRGIYWPENPNFILKQYSLMANTERQGFIKIRSVKHSVAEKGAPKIEIQVDHTTEKDWRLHLLLFRYLPEDLTELTMSLLDRDHISASEYFFQRWHNFYLSNRELSTEFRYCFDRKLAPRTTGNTLDRPKLVLKRTLIHGTSVAKQESVAGTTYSTMQEAPQPQPVAPCQPALPPEQKYFSGGQERFRAIRNYPTTIGVDFDQYQSYGQERFRSIAHYRNAPALPEFAPSISAAGAKAHSQKNRLSSHQDFISTPPAALFNLPASPDGKITVEIEPDYQEKYAGMVILAVEQGSVSHYVEALGGGKRIDRDLTLSTSLDQTKAYSEVRTAAAVGKFGTHVLEDIASTKFQIVDSLGKVLSVMKELVRLQGGVPPEGLAKFEQLVAWDRLPAEAKDRLFSALSSHELNLFIYKKDPEYFARVVKPYLRQKMEKALIDYYLLGDLPRLIEIAADPALEFASSPLERALLAEALAGAGKVSEAKAIVDRLRDFARNSRKEPSERAKTFDTALELNLLKSEDSLAALQGTGQKARSSAIEYKGLAYYAPPTEAPVPPEEFGEVKEYAETNYYGEPKLGVSKVANSDFWADYAGHFLAGTGAAVAGAFLSTNFTEASRTLTEIVAVLALLDLPFTSPEHGFKCVGSRDAELKAAGNLMLFKKEIKECAFKPQSTVLVAQRYVDAERKEADAGEEFLAGKVYSCQVVVTNIAAQNLDFEVLVQVPQGAIPLLPTPHYYKSHQLSLASYATQKVEYQFYFPSAGKFAHFPANVCLGGTVIARANSQTLNVVKTRTRISEEDYRDVLSTMDPKKILSFFRTHPATGIKGFQWTALNAMLSRDREFFLAFVRILREQKIFSPAVWSFALYHKSDENAIKEYLNSSRQLKTQVGYYLDSKIVTVRPIDSGMRHLDYYPVINARVHAAARGNGQPAVLNGNLYTTYKSFIMYLLEKPQWDSTDMLGLTYYLLLQDRVQEAQQIFTQVKTPGEMQVQYDYMGAYLDFYVGGPEYKLAREVVKKYAEYPVVSWRVLFLDMEQQLAEYDGKLLEESPELAAKKKPVALEKLLQVRLDVRDIVVESANIPTMELKYYVIDLEILFSRAPFLAQGAEDFSFVRPNSSEKKTVDGKEMRIPVPEKYVRDNVLIEVNGEGLKRLVTHFSTSLKVHVFENYGELQVTTEKGEKLPQVYVKAFSMDGVGKVEFYKDGYTDVRGRFDYALLSGSRLETVKKFSILVVSDKYGALIRECSPPATTIRPEDDLGSAKYRFAEYYSKLSK